MHENQKRNRMNVEQTVDLLRLLRALLKRAWVIILVSALCAVVVFGYTKLFVTPTYRSSFTAYVNNRITNAEGQSSMSSADISASRGLTYLYQEIILSRSVLLDAAAKCGLQTTYSELLKKISTTVSENAAIITVYVKSESPDEAEQLATAIADVAPDHVARVVDGSSMRVVDYPVKPTAPYAPNSYRYAAVGFVITLLAGCLCTIIFDLIVDRVDSPTELEDRYNITVIGIIPDMQQADKYNAAETSRRKSV